MTIKALYTVTYLVDLSLLAASAVSTSIAPGSKWHRVSAAGRNFCPTIIMATCLVVLYAPVGPDTEKKELAWTLTYLFLVVTAAAVATRIVNFGKERTWRRAWNFSGPPTSDVLNDAAGAHSGPPRYFAPMDYRRSSLWLRGFISQVVGATFSTIMLWVTLYLPFLHVNQKWIVSAFITTFAGVALFASGRKASLNARRRCAHIIDSPNELPEGSYVLYLRMFNEDRRRALPEPAPIPWMTPNSFAQFLSGKTQEEQLAEVVEPVGQMVAVGIPGESVPQVGAVRMYLGNKWKQPVSSLIERARLVIILLGPGPGTIWEIVEAISMLPPQRLILLVPWELEDEEYEEVREAVSRKLRARAKSKKNVTWQHGAFPSLPGRPFRDPEISEVGFIRFSENWEPQATHAVHLGERPWKNFFTMLTSEIGEAFKELDAYEQRTGRFCG